MMNLKAAVRIITCVAMVVAVVAALSIVNLTDRPLVAALTLLMVVILISSMGWGLRYVVYLSLLAVLGFSWSIPPVGHFHLTDSRVLIVLTAYLVSAITADQLSDRLRGAVLDAKRSEKELRDVINTMPTMAWGALPDGSNTFMTRQWTEYTGLSAEQMSGSGWQSTVHPEDLGGHLEKWVRSVATGQPFENEVRFRRAADGQYRWFLVRGVPSRDEQGNILKWYGIATDIEDRKRTGEALRRSEAYLAETQKLNKTGSWAWDPVADQVLYWSEEMFRILGFDPREGNPSAHRFGQLVHPEDRDTFQESVQGSLRRKVDFVVDHRIVRHDGTVRDIEVIGHPVFNASGELVEYVGTAVDITDRKLAEAELERLHQLEADLTHVNRVSMMGDLAASLAHEIKQPMAAAVTNAKTGLRWLQREPPDIEEARDTLSRIVKDVSRAADMIDRTRSLYSRGAPKREMVDLNELIREMIALLHDAANRYSVSMRDELDGALPAVTADRVQIQQVLMNLMLNGIEAMKDAGGELTLISKKTEDGQVLLSVSDVGIGLPVENTEHIFDAFFTTKTQGTGMGLSISQRIIESHGGRLWARANTGRGATFHFTLPAESSTSSTTAA